MKAPTILLVDDHPLVRAAIRNVLDGKYTICGEATDGKEAIDQAQALNPDLVLMDISMPVMGGLEAATRIRALLPRTKIIILSMDGDTRTAHAAKAAGADATITKTAAAEEIIALIGNFLSA